MSNSGKKIFFEEFYFICTLDFNLSHIPAADTEQVGLMNEFALNLN